MPPSRWLPLAAACLPLLAPPNAAAERFWKRFVPVQRVEADPAADYSLAEKNGPWLIMAATFSGPGAQRQARALVMEFRDRYNLPAYLHEMTFQLDRGRIGRGMDDRGNPVRMRHRKGDAVREWAVLVGDFRSVDDTAGQKLLATIKSLDPEALKPNADGETAQSLAFSRFFQSVCVPRIGAGGRLGPMRTAFLTRNPLLPQEYFTPKGVDKTIQRWNADFEHSLLNNPGAYTLRVATFTGASSLQGAKQSSRHTRGNQRSGGLEEAGVLAHELCEEMVAAGFEAYEFHDRHESIVTVGSFDRATLQGPGGRPAPVPEIARLVQRFGAAFDTPVMPLARGQLPGDVQAMVRAEKQNRRAQFDHLFQQQHGRALGAARCKFARIPHDAKNAKIVPFDVQPMVIETPKKSISAGFAWGGR